MGSMLLRILSFEKVDSAYQNSSIYELSSCCLSLKSQAMPNVEKIHFEVSIKFNFSYIHCKTTICLSFAHSLIWFIFFLLQNMV